MVSGDAIVLAGGQRSHVHTSYLPSDSGRSNSPMSRLTAYLGMALFATTGPRHFRECSYAAAILSLSDVYIRAKRTPPNLRMALTSWNYLLSFWFQTHTPERIHRQKQRTECFIGLIPPRVVGANGRIGETKVVNYTDLELKSY